MPRNDKMVEKCIDLLKSRGVTVHDIAECIIFLQAKYHDNLNIDECEDAVYRILEKNEVQHAILTSVTLDILAEQNMIPDKELQKMLLNDEPLYGVDEVMAYGICNLYGSIALTNFGYVDKVKPGIIGELNNHNTNMVHTFLDDIVGAIAASAASRLAHSGKRIDID